jgi:hypothetical protein
MTIADMDRLEAKAQTQTGLEFGTPVAVMPGALLELLRLARIGVAQEAQAGKPV